jgi:Na+/melibiose symporter-like transporter
MAVPSNGSYAFPSGHTQNAAVLWSYLAGHYRKKALVIVTVVMIPLVGLSRIYRGAHWPVDVLGGMAIGAALVWLALTIYRFWDHRSLSPPLWGQVALGVAVPLALFAVYPKTSLQTGSALGMIVGAANSGITLVRDIVLSDVIDEDELRTGRRREGSYFGVNAFIERLVMVLIGGSSSLVLGLGGYDAELTTQPPSVALGIRLGMGLLPVVALAVFLAALKYYPLGKEQVVALRGRLEALH